MSASVVLLQSHDDESEKAGCDESAKASATVKESKIGVLDKVAFLYQLYVLD